MKDSLFKKSLVVGIIILFIGVAALLVCSTAATRLDYKGCDFVESSDEIVIDLSFSVPSLKQVQKDGEFYCRVEMDGLPNLNNKNTARLPVKPVKILIPYGTCVKSVEVVGSGKSVIRIECAIEQGYAIIPLGDNKRSFDEDTEKSYEPERLFTVAGVHVVRGYSILSVNLYPVRYVVDAGELIWFNHMQVHVKTRDGQSGRCVRDVQMDRGVVTGLVDNPECIATYADAPCSHVRDSVEYVIITNEELKDASGDYTFQDLVDSKVARGMTAEIVTVEDIESNPDFSVNGVWGDNNVDNPFYNGLITGNVEKFNDTQAHIRNFIRYAYMEMGTKYVLLGGDADYTPSDNIVPVRELFAVEDGLPLGSRDLVEEDIPSDVYYACLDGNFNRDEDIHWGENATQNGVDDFDEADLLCEVYVGRACVDDEDEVSNFVMKTLSYEQCDDPYIYTGLMVGEYLGFPGVSAWGGNYKDLIIPFFPETFMVDTLYERDGTWSKYTLINILNTDTRHLLNHLGHGNVHYALKMESNDILSLTNDKFFFIYSQTCLAGAFDNSNSDCAAECFTVETPHGAFAVVMNARYGLGSENSLDSPSQVMDESFFKALFNENLPELGRANHYAKEDHVWHINENGIRWVYYETNLFGDPALRIKPYSDPPGRPTKPSGPDVWAQFIDATFTSTTIDPEGESIFYWFDWGDGNDTGWIGPYGSGQTGEASHNWTEIGEYEIKVKAKDVNDVESEWSEPATIIIVENDPPEEPIIKGPKSGKPRVLLTFKFVAEDPEGNDICYMVSWGDGDYVPWTELKPSGTEVTFSHAWSEEKVYTINVRAKDQYGAKSSQASFRLIITKSKNRMTINPALLKPMGNLMDHFPLLKWILLNIH